MSNILTEIIENARKGVFKQLSMAANTQGYIMRPPLPRARTLCS